MRYLISGLQFVGSFGKGEEATVLAFRHRPGGLEDPELLVGMFFANCRPANALHHETVSLMVGQSRIRMF